MGCNHHSLQKWQIRLVLKSTLTHLKALIYFYKNNLKNINPEVQESKFLIVQMTFEYQRCGELKNVCMDLLAPLEGSLSHLQIIIHPIVELSIWQ
jgi:hypothetical protein